MVRPSSSSPVDELERLVKESLPPLATIKEVAAFLGEHPKTTAPRCRSGELVGARQIGTGLKKHWKIPRYTVVNFLRKQPTGGY